MAKGVKPVERLRPSNGVQPTIRIQDNYTPPVGVPLSNVGKEAGQLANFLQQASGKAQQMWQQEVKTRSYMEQKKALELDYENPDGSYKTLEQLKESGELSFITPEVTMKMNEALGLQIGRDMQGQMFDWMSQNEEKFAAMSSDAFLDAFDGHITHLTKQPGVAEATLQPGVTKKIQDQLSGLRSQFLTKQAAASKEYAENSLRSALRNNIDAAIGTETDPVIAGQKLSEYIKGEGAYGLYKGSYANLNSETLGYVQSMIDTATTSAEVDRWISILENTQAGSGSIANTRAWKDGSRDVLAKAETRLAQLENKEWTASKRADAEALDAYGEALLDHLDSGQSEDTFNYEGEMGGNNEADLLARRNSVFAAWNSAENRPTSPDRWDALFEVFQGNDTATNIRLQQEVRDGVHPVIGQLSRSEIKDLPNIIALATNKPNAERTQLAFKDANDILKRKYDVVDFVTGAAKANLSDEAKELYSLGERKLRELYYGFASDPGSQIPEAFNGNQGVVDALMGMPPNRRMAYILANPKLTATLTDYLVDEVLNAYPAGVGLVGGQDNPNATGSLFNENDTEININVNGLPVTITKDPVMP
jgi:hypothetical protein